MSTNDTWITEFDALRQWILLNSRAPRLSSLEPEELSLARWLDAQQAADRGGTLDEASCRLLHAVPGAMPSGRRRSLGEWCVLIEGFRLDRGHLPSTAADDDYERSLGRYLSTTIDPAVRRGRPAADFAPLDVSRRKSAPARARDSERRGRPAHPQARLAAPAPAQESRPTARETEMQRVQEVRDYVSTNGYLPPRIIPLGQWLGYRLYRGDGPVPGAAAELQRIKDLYPARGNSRHLRWVPEAARHVARHGTLPGTAANTDQNKLLASLRAAWDGPGIPEHLAASARMVLDAPPAPDAYVVKWSAVFSDFTAWIDTHGRLPRRRTADAEEYRLANWLNVQRVNQRSGGLRDDLAVVLATVDGALSPQPRRLCSRDQWVSQVLDFYEAKGFLPRSSGVGPEEKKLGHWLVRERRNISMGRNRAEEYGALSNIPHALTAKPAYSMDAANMARLKRYLRRHGHFPPRNHRHAQWNLSCWVQRRMDAGPAAPAQVLAVQKTLSELMDRYPARLAYPTCQWLAETAPYVARHGKLPDQDSEATAAWRIRLENLMASGRIPADYMERAELAAAA